MDETPVSDSQARDTAADEQKIQRAMKLACCAAPFLSGLVAVAEVRVDSRIKTAGVFPSGRIVISPTLLDQLPISDVAFILAHELMHLFLQSHQRLGDDPDFQLVNIAHDLIINDQLGKLLSIHEPPAGGLNWRDFRNDLQIQYPGTKWKQVSKYSLEELVTLLRPLKKKITHAPQISTLGDFLKDAGITSHTEDTENTEIFDVLSQKTELEWFPDSCPNRIQKIAKAVQEAVVRAHAEKALIDKLGKLKSNYNRGTMAGNRENEYQILRGMYQTPWEAALQRWFDTVAPGQRSWARPSRRGAFRTDVVLPGRNREGWTLHIVLDTSGSMTRTISEALGAIDQFCQNSGVETVHILQCDVGVTADEWVEVGDLEHFQARGFGGSDMTPAMMKLAEDPEVSAVVVITDGEIYYPEMSPPYETLWCLTEPYVPEFPYGTIINLNPEYQ